MKAEALIGKALAAAGEGGFSAISSLHAADWASVYQIEREGRAPLAAKIYRGPYHHLAAEEGRMLAYLQEHTDVAFPEPLGVTGPVLVMTFIENDGARGEGGGRSAGEMLARLHGVTANKFGFERDTIFAPTRQPNPQVRDWPAFFAEQRLLYMAEIAFKAGQIDRALKQRIAAFCQSLGDRLPKTPKASLVHGDFWTGNVLFHQGRCAAFVDPAIYFGHGEVDLAFATLFGSPGDDFFAAYREAHEIAPGFFEERLDIYNLWPLLFHAYWFGGEYVAQVDGILRKFGY